MIRRYVINGFYKFSGLKYNVRYYSGKRNKEVKSKTRKPKDLKELEVWKNITVKEVIQNLNIKLDDLALLLPGINFDENSKLHSLEILAKNIHRIGWKVKIIKNPKEAQQEEKTAVFVRQPPPKPENLVKRPPVVTVMGHVDHGKTTLLDSLRNTFVVQQEFGGITQHIGAFSVEVKPGEKVTFIDTPGHAAFTSMRSRGAEVTDIVVLVIAADDGVMEQTVESINIIKRAQVPLIIAVNKIDKATAKSTDFIKEKLLVEGIQVEDRGGDVQLVPISALKKINLDLLTEVILLEAEVMNLKGDPTGLVEGVVIESKIHKKGILATVIIKRGTLKKGKVLMAGKAHAKVRIMLDENGQEYDVALPSTPVQILGWKDLPSAGDEAFEVESEKLAVKFIKQKEKESLMKKQEEDLNIIMQKAAIDKKKYYEDKLIIQSAPTPLEKRKRYFELKNLKQPEVNSKPSLNVILKGDVYGSLEVIEQILSTYREHDECQLSIVSSSVGSITLSDMDKAKSFDAIIYAFNVVAHKEVEPLIEEKNVDIRYHNVIYKLIDDLKEELNLRIPPKDQEKLLGEAEVLQHFAINQGKKKIPVAGCKCIKGELKKENLFRVIRDDKVIHDGPLESMKHHKNEIKTVSKGVDCGLMFTSFTGKFETGDRIICYETIKVPQKTSWNPGF